MRIATCDIRIMELTADASAIKEGGVDQIIIHNATAVAGGTPGLPAEGSHTTANITFVHRYGGLSPYIFRDTRRYIWFCH